MFKCHKGPGVLQSICNYLPTKLILGVLTFFPAEAELPVERLLASRFLTPPTPLLTMFTDFKQEALEVQVVEEEAEPHRELEELELFRDAVVVLLGAAVVEDNVCVTILGSVEGMGFPSLV